MSMQPLPAPAAPALARGTGTSAAATEALLVLLYFLAYLGTLFWTLEGEMAHWLTLVLLPAALLAAVGGRWSGSSLTRMLASVGMRKGRLTVGLAWAVPVGTGLATLQLLVSRNRGEILEVLASPRAAYLLPAAFGLLVLTAAFTEEFFFRGVLQTRLARWWGSEWMAVLGASFLFGVYHLPYAYLKTSWPSHGDWEAALASALFQGGIGGLVLGVVFVRSRRNLLAAVTVHAMINLLPATRWLASVWP